jgi:DNA-binding PadR family transcriptional regulator
MGFREMAMGEARDDGRGARPPDRAHAETTGETGHTPQGDPRGVLPLTPAVQHILLSLADGERHGYSILREVERASGGDLRLGATTLYRSIKRLLAAGLIEEVDERPDPALDDERRRYYRLTPFGQQVLRAETRRLAALVALAESKGVVAGDGVPGLSCGGAR